MPVRKMLLDALMTYMGGKYKWKVLIKYSFSNWFGAWCNVLVIIKMMWTVSMKVHLGSCIFLTCINNTPIKASITYIMATVNIPNYYGYCLGSFSLAE